MRFHVIENFLEQGPAKMGKAKRTLPQSYRKAVGKMKKAVPDARGHEFGLLSKAQKLRKAGHRQSSRRTLSKARWLGSQGASRKLP